MMHIFKYPVDLDFQLPIGAKILCVALQNGKPMVWAQVDSAVSGMESYGVLPTGASVSPQDVYCGTWFAGPYVWHLYRMPELDEKNGL